MMNSLIRSIIVALFAFNTLALAAPSNKAIESDCEESASASAIPQAAMAAVTSSATGMVMETMSAMKSQSKESADMESVPTASATSSSSKAMATESDCTDETKSNTMTSTSSPTGSPQVQFVTGSTSFAATRTISLAEATAIAQLQAANPSSLPDDENTQSVFKQIQAWVNMMLASGTPSDSGSSDSGSSSSSSSNSTSTSSSSDTGSTSTSTSSSTDTGSNSMPTGDSNSNSSSSTSGSDSSSGSVPSNCVQTVVPVAGDTCNGIEDKFGMQRGSLISMNAPRIDDKCFNLLAGETYCVKTA